MRADDPVYESLCHRGVKKLRENKGQTCTVIFVAAPPDKPPALPPPGIPKESILSRPSIFCFTRLKMATAYLFRSSTPPSPCIHAYNMRYTCVQHVLSDMRYQFDMRRTSRAHA